MVEFVLEGGSVGKRGDSAAPEKRGGDQKGQEEDPHPHVAGDQEPAERTGDQTREEDASHLGRLVQAGGNDDVSFGP
jgi:hypothetical protein